ncbi:MAG TPA: FecR domain-containing protein [Prolixibacteraceae bacterium]|nr:FecR domain-containing protein [Prolixibacteraceae bacterium]
MNEKIREIADRFLCEKACAKSELIDFKRWLSDPANHSEVEIWLLEHWTTSTEIDSNTLIETIFKQIQDYQNVHHLKTGFSFTRILMVYQKVAAFLLIPIVGLGIWFGVSQYQSAGQYTETIAPRGQKSQIVLADGTKVWLNSDTKIRYPGNFSKKQRDVYLDGEAFFEVTKNAHQPFIVHTSGVNVKVLGTKFNVKAYSDEDQIETSLFEGKINLLVNNPKNSEHTETVVVPGQSFVYYKADHQLVLNRFPKDEINGWKKNQLIFRDDTFSNLVRKVERWYNVKVVYDEKLFNDRRLTVELYEGERLERLMDIISLTLSVDFKYDKGEIILTPKARNM